MGYNELEVELRKTLAQIDRWREMGYMPTVEQGIALGRLQKIYAGLLDLPCSEPEAQLEGSGMPDSGSVPEEISGVTVKEDTYDGIAPDDESFESCCDPDVPAAASAQDKKADDDGNFADLSVEEDHRTSDETHLKQEYGAHDVCPPPSELPPAQDGAGAPEAGDTAEEKAGHSEETHMMQEFGSHDTCPEPDRSAQEGSAAGQSAGKVPEQPRIFGIEVSPYARHEIIDTLFHGNAELFEAETAKLNGMGSLEEALVYIGETYRWIPENAATIKFIDLLESRFEE